MNDLGFISAQLWDLFRCAVVPDELAAGGAMRCAVDAQRGIQLRFQPGQQRWMLGVDQAIDTLGEDVQARCHEALLRAAYASRWTAQQAGALDTEGRLSLVDCDFPGTPAQAAALAGAELIEGRLAALLLQLEGLAARPETAATATDNHSWLKA